MKDEFYKHLFSVEVVNDLVLKGMPFRDAYKKVGLDIEKGDFSPDQNSLNHVHEGSIGNLNLTEIQEKNEKAVAQFNFEKIDEAYKKLLS